KHSGHKEKDTQPKAYYNKWTMPRMKHHVMKFKGTKQDDEQRRCECPPTAKPDNDKHERNSNNGGQPALTERNAPLPVSLLRCTRWWIIFSCALQASILPARQWSEEQRCGQNVVAGDGSYLKPGVRSEERRVGKEWRCGGTPA